MIVFFFSSNISVNRSPLLNQNSEIEVPLDVSETTTNEQKAERNETEHLCETQPKSSSVSETAEQAISSFR